MVETVLPRQVLADAGCAVEEKAPPLVEHSYPVTPITGAAPSLSRGVWDAGEETKLTSLEVGSTSFCGTGSAALIAFMETVDVILTPAQLPARPQDDDQPIAYTLTTAWSATGGGGALWHIGRTACPSACRWWRAWRDNVALPLPPCWSRRWAAGGEGLAV